LVFADPDRDHIVGGVANRLADDELVIVVGN
jgi:hypothetical protein